MSPLSQTRPMDIVISGAGMAGLAAAISLRRCGHRVVLYERSGLNNEVGAAINVPPNVSRFLLPWGLDPARARFRESPGMYLMSHTTLEPLMVQDHRRSTDLYGAPLFFAHRVDLHEALKQLATDPDGPGIPAEVRPRSEAVRYDPATPSLTLANGTVVTGDVIIAADGVHSVAVEAVLGKPNPPMPARHDNCCYRFLIPRTELEADRETKFFLEGYHAVGARLFIDPADRTRRLVTYAVRDNEIVNFVAVCTDAQVESQRKEDWHATVDNAAVLKVFHGYHPGILAVIRKAKDVKRWPLLYRAPIPTYHKGRLALAGDAAHPMLPHHAQGGAQAIEDGLVLGLVFHGVTDPSQIEDRLAIYDKIRRNRASSIQVLSNYGFEEKISEDLVDYLEGRPVPKNMNEMIQLAYEPDLVQQTVRQMTELDPSWKLPDDFFIAGTPQSQPTASNGATDGNQ